MYRLTPITVVLASVLFGCSEGIKIEESDIVGQWNSRSDSLADDDSSFREALIEQFHTDYTYIAEGKVEMYWNNNGKSFVTLTASARGTWKIEESKVLKKLDKFRINSFESHYPGITREIIEDSIDEIIDEPEWLKPVKVEDFYIELEGVKEKAVYTMTRIQDNKTRDQIAGTKD
ncbi:MAG: hypothetical protein F6K19_50990, partial [Cyanothece sp. SIO1E1]|nr:hypothetical protein [Cyanothece sp. SIO1E1]